MTLGKQAYVGTAGVAEYLGVSKETVRNWIARGVFPGAVRFQAAHYTDVRPRRTKRAEWRIPLDEVEAWLGRRRAG